MARWLREWMYGADGPAVMADLEAFATAGDIHNFKSAMQRWKLVRNVDWTSLTDHESIFINIEVQNEKLVVLHRVLHTAVKAGQVSIVRYLIEDCGCTFVDELLVALHSEQWSVMELFFEKGWDINKYLSEGSSYSLLGYAHGSEAQTLWLLQHGANPNLRTAGQNRDIPSVFARYATVPCLKLLQQHGADFTKSDALHYAAEGTAPGRLEVMEYLLDEVSYPIDQLELEFLPDVHSTFSCSNLGTAIHTAVREECEETLQFLLEHGANRDKVDTQGKKPIELASEIGFETGVRLLHERFD